MRPRFLLSVLLTALGGSFAGCSSPTAPVVASTPAADEMPFPKLDKGMTAEVIRQKLGNPAEIQPMVSPEGKAEVWIYKYEKSLGMTQVAGGSTDVQVMSSVQPNGGGMITIQEPVFTLAEKKSLITLSLLMFNDRMQVQKAAVEETLEHH